MGKIDKNSKYRITGNVVARKIEDEIIIVPLTAGIGDAEDDLFSLNDTGKALWDYLDGSNSVKEIIDILVENYEGGPDEIGNDVIGFLEELISRNIIEEA